MSKQELKTVLDAMRHDFTRPYGKRYEEAITIIQRMIDAPEPEPIGAVLVSRIDREGVMFYSRDMIPDAKTVKDKFELIKVYDGPPAPNPEGEPCPYCWITQSGVPAPKYEPEPVAWLHDQDGRVDCIHKSVKDLWIKAGQPHGFYREKVPCKVEHYTIPLFSAPPATKEQVRWGIDWGKQGDRTTVSIVKHHPDGRMEVVAMEVEPIPGFTDAPPEPVLNPMCQWPFSNKGIP
jgi:hypothetical protein